MFINPSSTLDHPARGPPAGSPQSCWRIRSRPSVRRHDGPNGRHLSLTDCQQRIPSRPYCPFHDWLVQLSHRPPNCWGTHWLDLITVPQKPNNSAAIAAPQMAWRTNAFKSDLGAMASTRAKRPCHPAPRRPNKDLRFASGARGRYAVLFGLLEAFILVVPRQSKKWWRQRSTGRPMSERMLPLPCCWCSWRLGLMLRGSEPWRALAGSSERFESLFEPVDRPEDINPVQAQNGTTTLNRSQERQGTRLRRRAATGDVSTAPRAA